MDTRNQTWERERERDSTQSAMDWVGDLVTKASRQPVMVVEWQIWRPKTKTQDLTNSQVEELKLKRENSNLQPVSDESGPSVFKPPKPATWTDIVGCCHQQPAADQTTTQIGRFLGRLVSDLAVWSGGALILLCFHNICACDLYSYWHFKGFHVVLICLVAFSCRLI